MPRFLATLDASSRSETEASDVPSFFDSHPVTAERVRDTRERARRLEPDIVAAPPIAATRAAFLAKLEGLLVGPDPRHGVFHDSRFLHPDLRIAIDFPSGWETHNGDTVVAAVSDDGNALTALQAQQAGDDPLEAAQRFSETHSLPLVDTREFTVAGHPAFRAVAVARTREGPLGLDLCWIAYQGVIFRVTGMSSADRFPRFAPTFAAVGSSFSNLTDRELATIRDLRLRIVRARAGEDLAALSRRTGNALSLAETATANRLSPNARLAAGDLIKVAIPRPRRQD
jgi:predicted Zn-dependent protease